MDLDRYEIERYCRLEKELARLKKKRQYLDWLFYQQSFTASTVYGDLVRGVTMKAPRVEQVVLDHILTMEQVDKQIKIVQIKMSYWYQFLKKLKPIEKAYFDDYSTFNKRLDQLAIEEIKEIQVAVSLQMGYRDEDTDPIEIEQNDYKGNIQRLLSVMRGEKDSERITTGQVPS